MVQPSSSPWASHIVLVPKKDGKIEFRLDYRKWNEITTKYIYPLPQMDDARDALTSLKYCSTIDLSAGHWQIPLA
jgi:hypothetical protein